MKNAVLGMAEKRSPELAGWIKEHVSFPGTMVDRIVPAATDESLAEISQHLGVNDPVRLAANRLSSGWWKITSSLGVLHGKSQVYKW